jgi:hypothetical protein
MATRHEMDKATSAMPVMTLVVNTFPGSREAVAAAVVAEAVATRRWLN